MLDELWAVEDRGGACHLVKTKTGELQMMVRLDEPRAGYAFVPLNNEQLKDLRDIITNHLTEGVTS